MATYLTDDGICLRVTDFSETSQIVGMFTRRHGLVPLIAKGAKRQSKKTVRSGPLDLLTSGEVVFVPARETPGATGAQLGTLAEWQLSDHRRELRGNLPGLNAAMICAEVTTHLLQPHDPHEELFVELAAAFQLLASAGIGSAGRVLVSYLKAALLAAGYWPRLDACLACERPVGDVMMRFSARAGGVFCANCHIENGGTTTSLPGKLVVALDRLEMPSGLLQRPPERGVDPGALSVALHLLLGQVEAIADKQVRTRYLLAGIVGAKVE
ncbi:MAG TPA: DNA repair protein RecO [Phycisphaerae bacterium]|nr:DNA repair protein RecO [Phycisphaerae bacterium]